MEFIDMLFAEFGDVVSDVDIHSVSAEEESYRHIKLTVRLADGSNLRVSEFTIPGEDPIRYSYYWLDSANTLIVGWDNAPHHRGVSTFPHHKHVRRQDNVLPSEQRNLRDVLREIQSRIGGEGGLQPTRWPVDRTQGGGRGQSRTTSDLGPGTSG